MLDRGSVVPGSMYYGAFVKAAMAGLSAATAAVNPNITTLDMVQKMRRLGRRDMSKNFPPANPGTGTNGTTNLAGNDEYLLIGCSENSRSSNVGLVESQMTLPKQWFSRKRLRHDALQIARENNF